MPFRIPLAPQLLVVSSLAVSSLAGCAQVLSLDEFSESSSGGSQGDAQTDGGASAPLVFNIILRETVQDCAGCGIWFDWQGVQDDKPMLSVEFKRQGNAYESTYQHGLQGMDNAHGFYLSPEENGVKHAIQVKLGPQRTGLFRADISDIPPDATITRATLRLHIQTTEGLATADTTSVLSIHECERDWSWDRATWAYYDDGAPWAHPGGDFGAFVREIRVKEDLRDRGFSTANPNAEFDFTPHVIQLQAAR